MNRVDTTPLFIDGLTVSRLDSRAAKFYVDGSSYFSDLFNAISSATQYVMLTGLHFEVGFRMLRGPGSDGMRSTLGEVLQDASIRGVQVFLLVNQFWETEQEDPVMPGYARFRRKLIEDGNLAGYLPRTFELFEYFRGNDRVHCRTDIHPNSFLFGSHHQKTVVVDGTIAFLGGIDITSWDGDRWDTPGHRSAGRTTWEPKGRQPSKFWHDVHLRLGGSAVEEVHRNFAWRWAKGDLHTLERVSTQIWSPLRRGVKRKMVIRGVLEPRSERVRLPAYPGVRADSLDRPDVRVDEPLVQIVAAVPEIGAPGHELDSRRAYLTGINAARRYIYLENQWVSDEKIWAAIESALRNNRHNREFRVIVMVPYDGLTAAGYPANQDIDIIPAVRRAVQAAGDPLKFGVYSLVQPKSRVGVANSQIYVHSKLLIVDDDWVFVGSANAGGTSMQGIRGVGADNPDSELGAIIWSPSHASALRRQIWQEHLQKALEPHYLAGDADGFRAASNPRLDTRIRFAPAYIDATYDDYPPIAPQSVASLRKRALEAAYISPSFPVDLKLGFPVSLFPAALALHFPTKLPHRYMAYTRWEAKVIDYAFHAQTERAIPITNSRGDDSAIEFIPAEIAILRRPAASKLADSARQPAWGSRKTIRVDCFVQIVSYPYPPDNSSEGRQGERRISFEFGVADDANDSDLPEFLRTMINRPRR